MTWLASHDQPQRTLCNRNAHLSRRTLLGAGGGALMMSSLARHLALADEQGINDPARPKSVILLWLEGGPSQWETFDPHAGGKFGGEVKAIDSSARGIQVADLLPQTAEQMHLASLGDEGYFPFYEAAQELNAILTVHAGSAQGIGLDGLERMIEIRTLSHGFGQMIQMTSMMFGGVFDAFPRLKVAYAEAGCGWVPYLMERMDMEFEHRRKQVPHVKNTPSEHLRSGCIFIHCELEDQAIPILAETLRDDILFCASDYPHEPAHEFRENVAKFLAREDVREETKRKILWDNPIRMYS